jgi:hypothetical protein
MMALREIRLGRKKHRVLSRFGSGESFPGLGGRSILDVEGEEPEIRRSDETATPLRLSFMWTSAGEIIVCDAFITETLMEFVLSCTSG